MRFKSTIAYDGRPFRGWQSQIGGQTVQDELEAAAAKVSGEKRVPFHGAGRTDTGVHAYGQVAHFDAPNGSKLDGHSWLTALNAHLPKSIRVTECRETQPGFHARFDAKGKTYRYRIFNGRVLSPFEDGLVWHLRRKIDLTTLRTLASEFVGAHDFFAFAGFRGNEPKDCEPDAQFTTRTIFGIEIDTQGDYLTMEFSGSGFLYHMVRLITGSLLQCATGRYEVEDLLELLHRPNGRKSSFCAPADGLFLMEVRYDESPCGDAADPDSSQEPPTA